MVPKGITKHAHTHLGLCGSGFDAGLINDLLTIEALNRASRKRSRAEPSVNTA